MAESGIVLGSLLVAGVVFRLVRAYEPERVRGPLRVDPAEPMGLLAGVTFAGFAGWMLASVAAVSFFRGASTQSTTVPVDLPPLVLVRSGIIVQLAGLAVLGGANLIFRAGGLGRLGLSARAMPSGLRAGSIGVCFVVPAMFCVGFATEIFYRVVHLQHPAKHELLTAMDKSDNLHLRILAIISAVAIAPMFEELLFRGHLQTLLRRSFTERREPDGRVHAHDSSGRIWLGIVFASAAFAMVHPVWMYPPIFFLAVCLGYIYERSGSLWAPILVHAAFNAIQTAFSLAAG
ncbi:MAG: CPBP family intramembrane glutamic endopeptidase [Tepidisphaeraceae bacterium]